MGGLPCGGMEGVKGIRRGKRRLLGRRGARPVAGSMRTDGGGVYEDGVCEGVCEGACWVVRVGVGYRRR